jgi:hypothetical protein
MESVLAVRWVGPAEKQVIRNPGGGETSAAFEPGIDRAFRVDVEVLLMVGQRAGDLGPGALTTDAAGRLYG